MRRKILYFSMLIIVIAGFIEGCGGGGGTKPQQKVTAEIIGDEVVISINGEKFTGYKFASSLKKPYFWPIIGPVSGETVTAESIEPYPHHNSLFFGCDRVNGGNYWQEGIERGQIVSQGPKIILSSGEKVVFTDECFWQQPGEEAVIRDRREITISAPGPNLRFIDFDIVLEPLTDLRIERNNHSLFSARMVPELNVEAGGVLVNAQGDLKEAGTFGIESPWCDFYGKRGGVTEGLAILQHPANRWFPDKWFTRDYGFMSPTSFYWPENEQYRTFEKAELIALRYRVVIHAGDTQTADIDGLFQDYQKTEPVSELRLSALIREVESYEFGQSRVSLIAVTRLVNDSIDLPEFREKLADRLAQILSTEASFAGKRFVCEQLALIGTKEHIGALASLLAEERTFDIARYALERIATPAANEALLTALRQASVKMKVGIIGSLGQRGAENSINTLAAFVYDADASVASAAIKALSKIEYPESVAALEKAAGTLSGAIRNEALEAYLIGADRYLSRGEISLANQMFDTVYTSNVPVSLKAAAFKGVLLSSPNRAVVLANEVLIGENNSLHEVVFEVIRETQNPGIIQAAGQHFFELSADGQIKFLTAIRQCDDPVVLPLIIQSIKSENYEVRVAAVKCLSLSKEINSISQLAQIAADADGSLRQAARDSLIGISGPDIDSAFIQALDSDPPSRIACELIKAIAERRMFSASGRLLQEALGFDPQVRLETIKSLRYIAGENDVEGLVDLFVRLESASEILEAERTLVILASGRIDPAKLESTLLKKYPMVESIQIKNSILHILGQTRGSEAYLMLKNAINDGNLEVRKSAIKSLSNWSDAAPAEILLRTAQTDSDQVNQILALRGYIKLATLPSARSVEETVDMLNRAMKTASQGAEKKAILSALPSYRCEAAVALVESCLADDEIKKEAELALKQLGDEVIFLFDFQPPGAPVMDGFIEINPATLYDEQVGYGWVTAPGNARDRGAGTDQTRDFIFDSAARIFKINPANGLYMVSVYLGDMTVRHDQMSVWADEVLKVDKVTTAGGEVSKFDFEVNVADGVLDIRFQDVGGADANWVCAGIEIR